MEIFEKKKKLRKCSFFFFHPSIHFLTRFTLTRVWHPCSTFCFHIKMSFFFSCTRACVFFLVYDARGVPFFLVHKSAHDHIHAMLLGAPPTSRWRFLAVTLTPPCTPQNEWQPFDYFFYKTKVKTDTNEIQYKNIMSKNFPCLDLATLTNSSMSIR